jgi:hypothetical protein
MMMIALLMVIWIAVVTFVRWDPLQVVNWFMD